MKAKIILTISVCFFLVSLGFLIGLPYSESVKAENKVDPSSNQASLPAILGGSRGEYTSYKMIEGVYEAEGYNSQDTKIKLYNNTLTKNIEIGLVYVLKEEGISQCYEINNFKGTLIPPMGVFAFPWLSYWGISHGPYWGSGWRIIVTWKNTSPNEATLTGYVKYFYPNVYLTLRTINEL